MEINPWYICDECGDEVDGKGVIQNYQVWCSQCVYDFVEQDGGSQETVS